MIIEPTQHDHNGTAWYEIINTGEPYMVVGHTPDNIIRMALADPDGDLINAKALASSLNGFGSTTREELLVEVQNRGLTDPDGLLNISNEE